jgi:ADP-heptose:LPS heptosyltransferase
MRSIDYWLGIPLCLLLTGINYISRPIALRKKENPFPQKILFIKLSEMGSIILAYPLIKRVKKEYPKAEIFFLTFAKNKPVFNFLDTVPYCNILTIREETIPVFILDTLRAVMKIRKEKIDIIFDLEFFSRFTAIITYLSGVSKKVGFYSYRMEGLFRGDFLTHKAQYNPLLHITRSYLSLLQVVKLKKKSTPELEEKIEDKEISLPRYIPSQEAKKRMEDKLRRFGINERIRLLLINPGEGNIPLREWPLENFIALIKMLIEDTRNYIIIVGTQEASKKTQLLFGSVNNKRCLDLTHKTSVSEVLDLFNIADALITNDCGLAHLASLVSIKKFILFGPESPQVFSPLGDNTWIIYSQLPCSPCLSAFNHRNSACKDNKCLKIIKPEEVYEMIKKEVY